MKNLRNRFIADLVSKSFANAFIRKDALTHPSPYVLVREVVQIADELENRVPDIFSGEEVPDLEKHEIFLEDKS